MPRYIATMDGYLSDVAIYVHAGQAVEFPEGKAPEDAGKPGHWLVAEADYKTPSVMPAVGAIPVVSEAKPKAHEIEVIRPDYDHQMEQIVVSEGVQDQLNAQPPLAPAPVPTAPAVTTPAPAPTGISVDPVIDTTPQTANASQGSGNQDVLG